MNDDFVKEHQGIMKGKYISISLQWKQSQRGGFKTLNSFLNRQMKLAKGVFSPYPNFFTFKLLLLQNGGGC